MTIGGARTPASKPSSELLSAIGEILPAGRILTDEASLATYECDGLTLYRQLPMVAVIPADMYQQLVARREARLNMLGRVRAWLSEPSPDEVA